MPDSSALLLAAWLWLGVQVDPDERVLRSATVQGWLVEDVSEMDGGLMVRMRRDAPDFSLEWYTSYWRGNGGPVRGARLEYGDCASGDAGAIQDPAVEVTAATLRAQLAQYFAECEVSERDVEAALQGVDQAYALAALWAAEAEARVAAEAAAIANLDSDPEE
jgi:hypothetical protein